jgi:hypothetical protein
LIQIQPDPFAARRVSVRHANPLAWWDQFYRNHDDSPADLLETISYLGRASQFDQVEAAARGYLQNHPNKAEPWMYEALALAMDSTKRGEKAVKTALGYAAYLAYKNRAVDQLTMVADLLFMRKIYEPFDVKVENKTMSLGVGPLVDLAAEVAPHLPEPLMMSVNLAQKTRNPERMAVAVEGLLSLGWPDLDDAMRLQARREVEKMAKMLREDQRGAEADSLLARLAEAEGRDLFVRLTWVGDADLDLGVTEPLGAIACHQVRRTVFGGALVKEGHGSKHAEEVYSAPRAFDGNYTIRVYIIYNDPDAPVKQASLEIITHEGLPAEHKETRTVTLPSDEPIVVSLKGGRRRKVLPFIATAPMIAPKAANPAKPKEKAKPANPSSPAPRPPAQQPAQPRATSTARPANPPR